MLLPMTDFPALGPDSVLVCAHTTPPAWTAVAPILADGGEYFKNMGLQMPSERKQKPRELFGQHHGPPPLPILNTHPPLSSDTGVFQRLIFPQTLLPQP